LKKLIKPYYYRLKELQAQRKFKKTIQKFQSQEQPLKIVIGSSGIFDDGWIPSEAHFLNLLDEEDWHKYFQENEITNLVAEHVWEHLTSEQGKIAARNCYKYLKSGGIIRLAVPDGFHSDSTYIEYVKPNGRGAGADDHKVLYNYKSFSKLFSDVGFEIKLLEYFDENGSFQFNEWTNENGHVRRSIRYDERNKNGKPNYTSLIIDAIKTT